MAVREMSRSVGSVVVATISVALFAPGLPARAARDTPHWSDSGSTGPTHWSALEHDYNSCCIGATQSPIDIRDEDVRKSDLPRIECAGLPHRGAVQ
jgi:carbonic anhydrase